LADYLIIHADDFSKLSWPELQRAIADKDGFGFVGPSDLLAAITLVRLYQKHKNSLLVNDAVLPIFDLYRSAETWLSEGVNSREWFYDLLLEQFRHLSTLGKLELTDLTLRVGPLSVTANNFYSDMPTPLKYHEIREILVGLALVEIDSPNNGLFSFLNYDNEDCHCSGSLTPLVTSLTPPLYPQNPGPEIIVRVL
jgi:hypothetical protein